MIEKYQKPAELYDGLRLHQNENTGGCSPKVLQALAALTPEQVGFYPPYDAATRACAGYLGVEPERLSLVNGLDEAIMAIAVSYLRARPGADTPEAIIPEPAFEIFAFDTEVVGGRIVLANGEAAMVQSARAFDTFSFALEQSASSATVVVI